MSNRKSDIAASAAFSIFKWFIATPSYCSRVVFEFVKWLWRWAPHKDPCQVRHTCDFHRVARLQKLQMCVKSLLDGKWQQQQQQQRSCRKISTCSEWEGWIIRSRNLENQRLITWVENPSPHCALTTNPLSDFYRRVGGRGAMGYMSAPTSHCWKYSNVKIFLWLVIMIFWWCQTHFNTGPTNNPISCWVVQTSEIVPYNNLVYYHLIYILWNTDYCASMQKHRIF